MAGIDIDLTDYIIAVDDTDTPEEGGTGRLCRELAEVLGSYARVRGVSRHQLAVLPGIPYTRKNSANAIHLTHPAVSCEELVEHAARWVAEHCCPGSNPGLCVGCTDRLREVAFGRAAQQRVVSEKEAWEVAQAAGVALQAVQGNGRGIVGALAAAALAASGNDGRFVARGGVRDLEGPLSLSQVLAAGVDEVRNADGETVTAGEVIAANGLRPALCEGKCVLFVRMDSDCWLPFKGWPDDDADGVPTQGGPARL